MSLFQNNFSIWCDFIERDFLKKEFVKFLESEIVTGITSNPTIFKNSIKDSPSYDEDKRGSLNLDAKTRYESIAIKDIKEAADILYPLYNSSEDGLVSIEVSPYLADDTKGTIEEGKRLYNEIGKPNVMVKIPATKAGYEAMEELMSEGINVNATLIFSPRQAQKCLEAFKRGSERFQEKNREKKSPRAVISVFVSRFDRKLDERLKKSGIEAMRFGIMNASLIYQNIEEFELKNVRCLFASTGVSDKSVDSSYYITNLLYKNAINTAPLNAIYSFINKGDMQELIPPNKDEISGYFKRVSQSGIDIEEVYEELLADGLKQFESAFDELLNLLDTKKILAVKDLQIFENIKKDDFLLEKIYKEIDNEVDLPNSAKTLKKSLMQLVSYSGSDLHIKTNAGIKGRVFGEIVTLDNTPILSDDMEILVEYLLNNTHSSILKNSRTNSSKLDEFLQKKDVDFIYKLNDEYRFRVNMFFQIDGISAAFRAIPTKLPTVESLDLPEIINNFAQKQRGLILVTGPTGCGKSTTLATMLNFINQTSQRHVITIEDPVEFVYTDEESIINQRSIGESATTFSDALTSTLREDPDVIMVGEMRDIETIRTAIRAAETGHLVLSTLHTVDAKETISRIITMFDGNEQEQIRKSLSSVLEAIISQRLVRRKEKGRIAAIEIMVRNERIATMIAEKRESEILDAIEEGKNVYKSQSFNQALLDLYIKGKIRYHEALRAATSASDLKILLDNYDDYKAKIEDDNFSEKFYKDMPTLKEEG